MSMLDWARREVEIACKKERGDRPEGEWDYGCACYESALKAYESLCGDEHSGMSWGFTVGILKRLMDHKPLTPIEDVDEVWAYHGRDRMRNGEYAKQYQCKRKSSLFKYVFEDGRVEYSDVDRVSCTDIGSDIYWHNGFCSKIVNEMFPITMPYTGDKTYILYRGQYLTDRKNGDYDTMALFYVIDSDGVRTDIYRYFKEDPFGDSWIEIDGEEFNRRELLHNARVTTEIRDEEMEDSNAES